MTGPPFFPLRRDRSDRFSDHELIHALGAGWDDLAVGAASFLREPVDHIGARQHFALGFGQRLALLHGHQTSNAVRDAYRDAEVEWEEAKIDAKGVGLFKTFYDYEVGLVNQTVAGVRQGDWFGPAGVVASIRTFFVVALYAMVVMLPALAADRFITVASTTSTEQSGLFAYLLPLFRRDSSGR